MGIIWASLMREAIGRMNWPDSSNLVNTRDHRLLARLLVSPVVENHEHMSLRLVEEEVLLRQHLFAGEDGDHGLLVALLAQRLAALEHLG